MPEEEADSLCDAFAQRCSPENLHEYTINKLTPMAPARIRTTTVSFESIEMIIIIVSTCISIRLVVNYRMPPSKKNKLKHGTFVTEFSDYMEKLSCLRGNLIIVGDFNINWLDDSDSERRNLFNNLETFGLVQRIELHKYKNGNLLDYIITRQSSDIASNFMVSNTIYDHMALHTSLVCQRPHPEKKYIFVRALRRINNDSLEADLAGIKIDYDCEDVNIVVAQHDTSLSRLLDKLAPLKKICSVGRPMSDWMTDDIRALKAIRRKNEVILRKNPLFVNFDIFQKSCMTVKHAIDENKTQTFHKRITDSNGDQNKLFNIIKTLLGRQKKLVLPDYNDPITLASTFNMYFIDKIANIRAEFPLLESSLPPYSFGSMDSIIPTCANLLERFTMITSEELIKIVSVMNKTTCLSDPFPSKLLMSHLPTIIDTIMHIINLCLSTSVFSAVVLPLIKKPCLYYFTFGCYSEISQYWLSHICYPADVFSISTRRMIKYSPGHVYV